MVDFHSWSRWGNRKQIYLPPKIAKHLQNVWNNSSRLWVSASVSYSVVSDYLRLHGPQPARLLYPWHSPDKKTGVGYHSLLRGIFLAQGSNLGLVHCKGFFFTIWATREGSGYETTKGSGSWEKEINQQCAFNWSYMIWKNVQILAHGRGISLTKRLKKFLRGRDKAQNLDSHRHLEFTAQERRELCRQNSNDLQRAQLIVVCTNQH